MKHAEKNSFSKLTFSESHLEVVRPPIEVATSSIRWTVADLKDLILSGRDFLLPPRLEGTPVQLFHTYWILISCRLRQYNRVSPQRESRSNVDWLRRRGK